MNPEDFDALLSEVATPAARPEAAPAPTSGSAPSAADAFFESAQAATAEQPASATAQKYDAAGQIGGAIVTGAAKSIYETKDFIFGKTAEEDKSPTRRALEGLDRELAQESIANSFVSGLSQFATGMLGAGKLVGLAKAVPAVGGAVGALEASRKGAAVLSSGKAAAVGAVAFDPSGPRLSDLVQKFPALQNPVSEFLASQPGDSAALGRAKNALESIGVDAALAGVFAASVAGFKALKAGDGAVAEAALKELDGAVAHKDAKLADSKGDFATVEAIRETHPEAVAQVEAAPGRATYSLQREGFDPAAPPKELDRRQYSIMKDGEPVGTILMKVDGDMAEIRDIYSAVPGVFGYGDYRGALGSRAMMNLLKQFVQENPQIARLTGERVSGARRGGQHDFQGTGEQVDIPIPESWRKAPEAVPVADALTSDAMSARSPRRSLAEREAAGEAVDYGPDAPAHLQDPPAPDVTVTRVDSPTQGAGPEGLPARPKLIDVTDEQVSKLIAEGAADADALMGPGGWEGAIGRGYKFGDGGSIPWQKLAREAGTPEGQSQLDLFIARVADELRPQFDTAKGGTDGVLSDAAVDRLVAQRKALYNEDPQALLGHLQLAGSKAKSMVVEMEAAQLIGNRAMLDALNLGTRIRLGMLEEFGGDLKAARAALEDNLAVASSFWAEGQAMRASAGRALRRNRADFAFTPEDLASMKSLDDGRFFNILDAVGHDFQVANKLVRPGFWSRLKDDAAYLYVNNLLWGLRTHFVNLLTNSYMVTGRPLERILGAGIQGDMTTVRQNWNQYGYMGASLGEAWRDAVRTWKSGDSIMSPHTSEVNPQGVADASRSTNWVAEGYKQWDSIPNVLSNAYTGFMKAAGLPTRALGTVDELTKQVVYRSKVMSAAHADGIAAGLEGEALKEHVRGTLLNAFDDAGRAVDLKALEEANIATFQQDLIPGTFGATVQHAVANHAVLRFVVPFVKTPTNVLRTGWKMTPGLNMLQSEYRQMIRGELGQEQQAQAIGQMAMGSLFLGNAAYLASAGYITGGGPSDRQLRQQLMATGWQPYSFVVSREDGSKSYVNFGRYDPVAMPMGIVADIVDILSRDQDGDGFGEQATNAAGGLLLALAKQMASKTYLTSLHDTLDAIMDPDRNMAKTAGAMAANFVPFSSGLRFANPDIHLRDTRGVVDKIMATVPGLSEKLPPRRDVFGDPLTVHKGLWVDGEATAVDAEVRRMVDEGGVMFGPPSPVRGEVDLRDVTMVDGRNAFDRYQELAGKPGRGPSLKETVARIMKSEAYKKAPDGDEGDRGTKLSMLTGTISKYREAAFKQLKADPSVRAALAKRAQDAAAAVAKANAPKTDQQTGAAALANIGRAAGVDLTGLLPQ